jgi:signal transduction histidine kinase
MSDMKDRESIRNSGTHSDDPSGVPTSVSHQILRSANRSYSIKEFANEITKLLVEFSGADCVEIRLAGTSKVGYLRYCISEEPAFTMSAVSCLSNNRHAESDETDKADFEWLCSQILDSKYDQSLPFYTSSGSFFVGDSSRTLVFSQKASGHSGGRTVHIGGSFTSLVIIPFPHGDMDKGLLILGSKKHDFFSEQTVMVLEGIAQILGIAFQYHNAQVALRERVKELSCLYDIARVANQPDTSLEDVLKGTAALLPPAWLYPDIACSRILLDGQSFAINNFQETYHKLSASIVVGRVKRGTVEVAYSENRPELDEGPFLKEERNLINAVAREVSLILEKRRIEKERSDLREQFRHAHRLATIGQLAAGVAHELNEPLGNILGFAQLAEKQSGTPTVVRKDLQKIIKASLHGREVVRKLMIFARQTPPQKVKLNINDVVRDSLYFFESRCANAGIELTTDMDQCLPEMIADRGQLYQVLVNLVVNAIQAMPDGGKLTISTGKTCDEIYFVVEDSGIGMNEAVIEKLFVPFFTTKDVNEGTGLGLSVVHGIVTSHGGTVTVDSKIGEGARFTVRLPTDGNGPEQNPELFWDA